MDIKLSLQKGAAKMASSGETYLAYGVFKLVSSLKFPKSSFIAFATFDKHTSSIKHVA